MECKIVQLLQRKAEKEKKMPQIRDMTENIQP